jgi:hypothetical protein
MVLGSRLHHDAAHLVLLFLCQDAARASRTSLGAHGQACFALDAGPGDPLTEGAGTHPVIRGGLDL